MTKQRMIPSERRPGKGMVDDGSILDEDTFAAMFSVLQGGMRLLNDLESYLMPFGLSQGRLSILLAVTGSEDGSVNPMDIARITGKSRPTVSRMIDRLEADGLLLAGPDIGDRRRKRLRLTDHGGLLLEQVVPGYNRRLRSMSDSLDSRDKHELVRILGKIDFPDSEKRIGSV